jgi:hypothetical protein
MATKNGKDTRADKIYEIIKDNGGRMRVADLIIELARVEDTDPADLQNKVPPPPLGRTMKLVARQGAPCDSRERATRQRNLDMSEYMTHLTQYG